jgi:hypothetical protein
MMKLRQVNQTFNKHLQEYYYSMFGYAKIALVKVYPLTPWSTSVPGVTSDPNNRNVALSLNVAAPFPQEKWVIYDLPRPLNTTGEAYSYTSTYYVVTLRDQLQGGEKVHYGYGYIEVGVYG